MKTKRKKKSRKPTTNRKKKTRKKNKHKPKGCGLNTSGKYKKIYKKLNGKGLTLGMITVPLSPDKQFFQVCGDSYIASYHINWLKRYCVSIIPIPWSTKKFDFYFKLCNGFYFPSGGAFAGTQKEYYNCCKTFFNMAIKENDKGRYTPIWGLWYATTNDYCRWMI